ncbi:hypothetical protein POM88_017660 [Heracleum sosnowskyi]|uniref:Uncharacterized protein n=1 Tax=Heracleum sosnowskyi TaxID=360622 RepID=A0AAD8IP28_9APIA|nr:hypothetical protein POM88_017660 [Heracleum sosnowskyi]
MGLVPVHIQYQKRFLYVMGEVFRPIAEVTPYVSDYGQQYGNANQTLWYYAKRRPTNNKPRFKFCYILMVSEFCSAGGYIVSRIEVVGLEHKQKLELRLDLMNLLFAGSFG